MKTLIIAFAAGLLAGGMTGCTIHHRIIFDRSCEPVTHECSMDGCDYEIHCPPPREDSRRN
jgi:hypothetical protein